MASRTTTSSTSSDVDAAEWVLQDYPGVFVTVRQVHDGPRELRRVKFRFEVLFNIRRGNWLTWLTDLQPAVFLGGSSKAVVGRELGEDPSPVFIAQRDHIYMLAFSSRAPAGLRPGHDDSIGLQPLPRLARRQLGQLLRNIRSLRQPPTIHESCIRHKPQSSHLSPFWWEENTHCIVTIYLPDLFIVVGPWRGGLESSFFFSATCR